MQEATLLFLRGGGAVLLGLKKRGYGEGKWNGIGGKLQPGETVLEALIRECQEEISVLPTSFKKVGVLTVERAKMCVHVFTASSWQGEPEESEEMLPRWFNCNDIPYADMWPTDNQWLPIALNNRGNAREFKFVVPSRPTASCGRIDS